MGLTCVYRIREVINTPDPDPTPLSSQRALDPASSSPVMTETRPGSRPGEQHIVWHELTNWWRDKTQWQLLDALLQWFPSVLCCCPQYRPIKGIDPLVGNHCLGWPLPYRIRILWHPLLVEKLHSGKILRAGLRGGLQCPGIGTTSFRVWPGPSL